MDLPLAKRAGDPKVTTLPDEALVTRIVAGETELFELVMRRNNPRVYRTVRAVIRDEADAEEVMQQAYLSAYANLARFQGGSRFSTWLTRIALNEALMRLRRARRWAPVDGGSLDEALQEDLMTDERHDASPEEATARGELAVLLERAVDALPPLYRTVFILRDVEELSTRDCAEALTTTEDVVKTRLHRAKAMLRERLSAVVDEQAGALFPFHATRCDRVVEGVMRRLRAS